MDDLLVDTATLDRHREDDKGGTSVGMGPSSGPQPPAGRPLAGRRVDAAPVYGYERVAGRPPVTVTRFEGTHGPVQGRLHGAHAHDFLVLSLVDRGAGRLCLDVGHPAGVQSMSSRRVMARTARAATPSTIPEKRLRSTFAQNHAIGIKITIPIR